jgi:vacuole morphology and inheritance protein 14
MFVIKKLLFGFRNYFNFVFFNFIKYSSNIEIDINFLVQIDNLIQYIESPVFVHLRLHLLDPQKYPYLIKSLYGILMVLPQSASYQKLNNRLSCVSSLSNINFM